MEHLFNKNKLVTDTHNNMDECQMHFALRSQSSKDTYHIITFLKRQNSRDGEKTNHCQELGIEGFDYKGGVKGV